MVLRILSVVLIIALTSCTSEEDYEVVTITIDINENYTDPNLNLKIDQLVPLQTTEESQFGDLHSAKIFNGKLYLLDRYRSKSLFAFDLNGNFINKTKLGKGPEEIIEPISFFVDQVKGQIVVYDQMLNKLVAYDLDLKYISSTKYQGGVGIYNIDILDNQDYVVRTHFSDFVYVFFDSDFRIKSKFIADKEYNNGQDLLNLFTSNGSRYLFIAPHDYYIYEYANDLCEKKYFLDFGDYNLNDEEINKGIWPLVKSGKKITGPMGIAETETFIWFYVVFNREKRNYLYHKSNSTLIYLNEYFRENKLPETQILGTLEKSNFFGLVNASDLMEFQDKTEKKLVSGEVNESQNPIFIEFHFED